MITFATIGDEIRHLRLKHGLSQRKMAKDLNFAQNMIMIMENKQHDVGISKYQKVLDYLGYELIVIPKEGDSYDESKKM